MTGKYQLYVGILQDIPDDAEFSYYDSVKRRLFLFCDGEPGGNFAPVPPELWSDLTPEEAKWLSNACREVNRRWMEAHEAEAEETANAFLDQLEKEFKKEARKARKDKHGKDANGGESGSE